MMDWAPLIAFGLMALTIGLSAWFDHYSKARLHEAIEYWRRSKAAWEEINDLLDGPLPPRVMAKNATTEIQPLPPHATERSEG